jgi:hypothetical protein
VALIAELAKLQNAWGKTRRSRGGVWALAGFDYQLSLALLEIIRRFNGGERESILVEAVSDTLIATKTAIIIVQAKRTLTGNTYRSALQELWEINSLARHNSPRLVNKLIYQVHSSRQNLSDCRRILLDWVPEGMPANDPEVVEFRNRVECLTTPDPRMEASSLLVRDFHAERPFEYFARFVGYLMEGAEAASFSGGVQKITIELESLKATASRREHKFHLWSINDRPPLKVTYEPDTRKAVRIGQRLTLLDLREGCIANRSVFSALHESCERWLSENATEESRVPIFWVHGRSGSGKSAAILHLVARVHDEDPSRIIIWLGGEVDRFEDATDGMEESVRTGESVIFVLDDPYSGDRSAFERGVRRLQDIWQRARLSAVDSATSLPGVPMVLCCSPTEQLDMAEADCGDAITVCRAPLRQETREDLHELAVWYQLRTGTEPPRVGSDSLLVQRFFEWQKGDLSQFAHRFRRRLENFDPSDANRVFETITNILALGRLYVDYPSESLERLAREHPILEAALIQLAEEEQHLSFTASERSKVGIRLTHPHLADAIYRVWFGRSVDRGFRRAHLEHGIRAGLSLPGAGPGRRYATLWGLVRLASGRSGTNEEIMALRARLDLIRRELSELLPALFHEIRSTTITPLADLSVWVKLDVLFDLHLVPAPRDILLIGIAEARGTIPGLRLACHVLLEHREDDSQIVDIVLGLIQRSIRWGGDGSRPWHDWWPLALDFLSKLGSGYMGQTLELAVQAFPTASQIPSMISKYYLSRGTDNVSPDFVLFWLESAPTAMPGWARILGEVYERFGRSHRFDRLAFRFLVERFEHPSWSFFWMYLWEEGVADREDLLRHAFTWLRVVDPKLGSWSFVWERLLKDCRSDPQIRVELSRAGIRWLRVVDAEIKLFIQSWEKLWSMSSIDKSIRSEVTSETIKLLKATDVRVGKWSAIWSRLWKGVRDDASAKKAVARVGRRWVCTVGHENESWPFIWVELFNDANPDTRIRSRLEVVGRTWLSAVEPRAGWHLVWNALWIASRGADKALYRSSRRWLSRVPISETFWRNVWETLWKAKAIDEGSGLAVGSADLVLRALGRRFLTQTSVTDFGWPRIYVQLRSSSVVLIPHHRMARSWLEGDPKHPSWSLMFNEVWKDANDNERLGLKQLGLSWLTRTDLKAREKHLWWYVLNKCINRSTLHQSTKLRNAIQDLLIRYPPKRPDGIREMLSSSDEFATGAWSWKDAWEAHWIDAQGDFGRLSVLAEEAKVWLSECDLAQRGWTSVWMTLWEVNDQRIVARALLEDVGRKWLRVVDPKHPRWASVWLALWRTREGDPRSANFLVTQGLAWLSGMGSRITWHLVWSSLWDLPALRNDAVRAIALARMNELPEGIATEIENLLKS